MTRTRRAALAGLSALAPAALAACSPGQPSAGPTAGEVAAAPQIKRGATIQWAVDDGPTRTPLRQDQTKLFNDKFPDVKVEYITGATGTEKLQTLFAAGTPPDLFRQETSGMAFFASRSQITSLDPLIRRDKYDLSDFFPATWALWKWKGKHMGVPFLGIRILFFNRALAQQVGTRIPTTWKDANWTWAAFLDACQKVKQSGATRWGTELGTSRRDWQPWLWNNDADLFNEDGTKLLIDQPNAIEALQYLADLMHRHRVAPSPPELQAAGGRRPLFEGGNLLSYHNPVNNVAENRRGASFDWSIAGLPRGKAKQSSSSGGGPGWFLTAESKVKDETWELMKVLASKESVRMEAVRGEAPPSRKSVANEPEFVSPPEPPKGDMKVVVEALEALHVETALVEGVEIDRILTEELTPVWRGEKQVREAINAAALRIRPLLNPTS